MGSDRPVYGAGHIVSIPEIHEGDGDPAEAPEGSPAHQIRPHLTVEIPSRNSEDSTSYHARMRTLQTPVSGSSRTSRTHQGNITNTNWNPWSSVRMGASPVQPSPSGGSPSVKKMLRRFSSKLRGAPSETMRPEGLPLSSPSVKGGGLRRIASLPFAKLLASPSEPSSLPVTPLEPVSKRRLSRSFSAPLNRKPENNRRGGSSPAFFRVVSYALGAEADGVLGIVNDAGGHGEDIPQEEAVCRICLTELGEGGESMKLQCSCKGDLALAHRECAIQWFTVKGNKNCDVCKEEVQNLPVTLVRLQTVQPADHAGPPATGWSWAYLVILLVVNVLAYCCLLALLLAKRGATTTAVSLPCGVLMGLLSSFTSTAMATRVRTLFLYAAVQFALVLLSVYIFLSLFHIQIVASILLATSVGFGLAMCVWTAALSFLRWWRRRRALAASAGL